MRSRAQTSGRHGRGMASFAGAKDRQCGDGALLKDGACKLLSKCTLSTDGRGEADVIISERAIFQTPPNGRGFVLEEVARGYN